MNLLSTISRERNRMINEVFAKYTIRQNRLLTMAAHPRYLPLENIVTLLDWILWHR